MKLAVWHDIAEGEEMPEAIFSFGRSLPGSSASAEYCRERGWTYDAAYMAVMFPIPIYRRNVRCGGGHRITTGWFLPCADVVMEFSMTWPSFAFYIWPVPGWAFQRSSRGTIIEVTRSSR